MKRIGRKILTVFLVFVLLSGLFVITRRQFDYRKGGQDYGEARQTAGLPEKPEIWNELGNITGENQENTNNGREDDPYMALLAEIDLEALQRVNPDVIGWIAIPGTEVSYPLLCPEDNSYYLNHTWKKDSSAVGSIFLDCRKANLNGFNTIIYGHNMRDGSMFGSLKQYQKKEYWTEHPSIYLVTGEGVVCYDIFAAWEAGVEEAPFRLSFSGEEERQAFLENCQSRSAVDSERKLETEDQVLTLSTCTGRGYDSRWVVQAVKGEQ